MSKQVPFFQSRAGVILTGAVMTIVFVGIVVKSFYVFTA